MNKESNQYTLIYASVLVIIVAVALAFTSQVLNERQKKNEAVDKMRQILRAVNIDATAKDADAKYAEFITASYSVNETGEKVSDDGFSVELVKEVKKSAKERQYPVFEANIEGEAYYIMALRGAGLWGPLWGYISVSADRNTVYGSDFSHQGETPGLGAEISTAEFCQQFTGKQLFVNGEFKSIAVVKKGKSLKDQDYVDGISGGTITSVGVHDMLLNSLSGYEAFLKNEK